MTIERGTHSMTFTQDEPAIESTETFWGNFGTAQSYDLVVLESRGKGHPVRFFLSEEERGIFTRDYRDGCGTINYVQLNRLHDGDYAWGDVEESRAIDGIYLMSTEAQGIRKWYWTSEGRECSLLYKDPRHAIIDMLARGEEIYEEEINEYYADQCYESEGPYGGAFRDQEDYENWRFGGISYLNSI